MNILLKKHKLLNEAAVEYIGVLLSWWNTEENTALEINQREINGNMYMTGYLMSTTVGKNIDLIFQVGFNSDYTTIEEDAVILLKVIDGLELDAKTLGEISDVLKINKLENFTIFFETLLNAFKDSERLFFEVDEQQDEDDIEGTLLTLIGMIHGVGQQINSDSIKEAIDNGNKIEGIKYQEKLIADFQLNKEEDFDSFFDFLNMTDFKVTKQDLLLIESVLNKL